MAVLLYQGHGSLRITTDNGTVLYIDPYAGDGYDKPADLILVTHQHYDHTEINRMPHNDGCIIWQNMDALKDGKYRKTTLKGIPTEATEAYNANHPKAECVGYLLTLDGKLCYFAGDTSRTKQMETFADRHIDWCFLPTDGIYNMDIPEAMECGRCIAAKHTVPIHMSPGNLFDREKAKTFQIPGAVIVNPGEEIKLD